MFTDTFFNSPTSFTLVCHNACINLRFNRELKLLVSFVNPLNCEGVALYCVTFDDVNEQAAST